MRHFPRLVHWFVMAGLLALTDRGPLAAPGAGNPTGISPNVLAHLEEARALGLYRERGPALAPDHLLEMAARSPLAPTKVWVFFTDKGLGTRSDLDQALALFRSRLNAKTRQRRASLGPDLGLDVTDVPVFEGYIQALEDAGCRLRRTSRWLNAASVEMPAGKLNALAAMPFVRYVEPVLEKRGPEPDPEGESWLGMIQPQSTAAACSTAVGDTVEAKFYGPSYNQLGQIQTLNLQRLGYSGAGVRVMMLDTGFLKTHPAFLNTKRIAEWDFVNEDGNTQNEGADDPNQQTHGTGTWGVVGGYAPGALIGGAFAAEFVLAKTEDITQEVHAEEDNYVAALEWADTLGVDVTTASLAYLTFDDGTGYTTAQLDGDTAVITRAVDIAVGKGMACVNAMGNDGPGATTLETPADADSVIAVGAVDSCGTVASFSSRGPTADARIKPEIVARGVRTYWARASTLRYGPASGTSLSTPLIAGLAALLKEAHPTWSGYQIRAAIMGTGTQSGTPDNSYGWGLARGLNALTFGGATPAPPRMTLPFKLLSPADGAVTSDTTPTLRWSSSKAALPGDHAVYRILIDDHPSFASPETIQAGSDTSYTFPTPFPPVALRWWKVEATGNLGYVRRSMNTNRFGVSTAVAVGPEEPTPARFVLGPAVPNPMRATTSFVFRAPVAQHVAIELFAVSGRLIRRFEATGDGNERAISWDGTDATGQRVPVGMYFYRLSTATGAAVPARKILVISR
jgi:subtilisin family serine protease